MRLESIKGLVATSVAAGLILSSSVALPRTFGDEPSRLGRLFRMGNSNSSSATASGSNPTTTPSTSTSTSDSAPSFLGQPALSTPPSTPPGSPAAPRVTPKPRVNKPITEADPLVTRVSLGRSDTGSQFGMLLQVFADGTVIDGEGVHHVKTDVLKPVVDAVASGDLSRLKGHCGGPAGDFIENVHVIVYERALGRLRATSFSYSGNPQGCDHSVHHLQKVLDELQARLSPNAPSVAPTASNAPANGLTAPPLPLTSP